MKKFSINQDEDVWSQLLYGIRYLDLRVGYYKTTPEKFWIVHDFVKMNPLYEVVNDVRRFLTSTKELVIMDFHRYEVHKYGPILDGKTDAAYFFLQMDMSNIYFGRYY